MKKLLLPITGPLDLLHRFRTSCLFLTINEARAAVQAAKTVDTEEGRKYVDRLNDQFLALQRIAVEERHDLLELRMVLNVRAMEAMGKGPALSTMRDAVTVRIINAMEMRDKRIQAQEQKRKEKENQ